MLVIELINLLKNLPPTAEIAIAVFRESRPLEQPLGPNVVFNDVDNVLYLQATEPIEYLSDEILDRFPH